MTIEKKLLVLVDGSERSIQTVNYVKDFMPVDENTKIVLFHVFSSIPEEYRELDKDPTCVSVLNQLKNWETDQQRKIIATLELAKEILITGGFPEQSVEIKFHYLENGVARDIIEEARDGYSAVVLRRRGMGAMKSMILGSVAVKLLQSLTFLPIIIVGQAPSVKKILLAVDDSPFSMRAVQFVASLLGGHGYEISVFHAIPGLGAVNFELPGVNTPEFPEVAIPCTCVELFRSKVLKLFQVIKEILIRSGFEPEKISEKIVTGVYSRSETITREAEEGGYGTIVVGRRGLSKVEAFFMGRVGHKVVYGGKRFTVWVV